MILTRFVLFLQRSSAGKISQRSHKETLLTLYFSFVQMLRVTLNNKKNTSELRQSWKRRPMILYGTFFFLKKNPKKLYIILGFYKSLLLNPWYQTLIMYGVLFMLLCSTLHQQELW